MRHSSISRGKPSPTIALAEPLNSAAEDLFTEARLTPNLPLRIHAETHDHLHDPRLIGPSEPIADDAHWEAIVEGCRTAVQVGDDMIGMPFAPQLDAANVTCSSGLGEDSCALLGRQRLATTGFCSAWPTLQGSTYLCSCHATLLHAWACGHSNTDVDDRCAA
jgi:hypothetical protein